MKKIEISYKRYTSNTDVFVYEDGSFVGYTCIAHTGDDGIPYENEDGKIDKASVQQWARCVADEIQNRFIDIVTIDEEVYNSIVDRFESILGDLRTD